MRERYYTIENGKVKVHRHPVAGCIVKRFEEKQDWHNWANTNRLKVVDGDIHLKTEDEMDAEAASAMTTAQKLDIRRAMEALDAANGTNYEARLDAMLDGTEYGQHWRDDDIIEIDDPMVIEAMAQMNIDFEAVKLQIFKNKKKLR